MRTSIVRFVALAVVCLVSLGLSPVASAMPSTKVGTITEFPVRVGPFHITPGPDGNMWFTEPNNTGIGSITTQGTVTRLQLPAGSWVSDVAAGPDGDAWFTEDLSSNRIARATPDGLLTEFPLPTANSSPDGIAAGPDGNMWFTERSGNNIGRITPAGVITEYPVPAALAGPLAIAAGPDGNMWFTEQYANNIARITPAGVITEYAIPTTFAQPVGIAAGPDGNMWFTEFSAENVGRITPDGSITEFAVPDAGTYSLEGIAAGPDGNVWFTEWQSDIIGRITPDGDIREFHLPRSGAGVTDIAAGPDGNLWFTEWVSHVVGRITDRPLRSVGLSPTSGPPSSTVQVVGSGWGSYERVTVGFNDSVNGHVVIGRATTDMNGNFTTQVTVPANASPGAQNIRVKGHISDLARRGTFTVS